MAIATRSHMLDLEQQIAQLRAEIERLNDEWNNAKEAACDYHAAWQKADAENAKLRALLDNVLAATDEGYPIVAGCELHLAIRRVLTEKEGT